MGGRTICPKCGVFDGACSDCARRRRHRDYQQAWAAANPDRMARYQRRYRERYPGRKAAQQRALYRNDPAFRAARLANSQVQLLRQYGLTPQGRERLFAKQHGKCALCGQPPDPGRPFHVDHDHKTGRVRGLVHFRCNTLAGYLERWPSLAPLMPGVAAYVRRR